MIREILFKAKRIDNGEWVEGYLMKYSLLHEVSTYILPIGSVCDAHTEVNPETVCQYTGLTDKNGKKIWENDIVLIDSNPIDEEDGYFTVEWYSEEAMFKMSGTGLTTDFDTFYGFECEVVGNTFDNPELLKGGAE